MVFSILRQKGAGRRWWERWPSKIDWNWGKQCCRCLFGQKWPLNRIKNDSRIFEQPQACSSSFVCRFVPHFLTPGQREDQVTTCQDIITMADADKKFFNKIITVDETWCFPYDPETKRHNSEWVGETSPRPKKLEFLRSRIKAMLIIFFDSQSIVHKEFVSEGKTVNAEFYEGVMDRLLKHICWVCPAAFCSRDFFLYENVPAHKAASFCQFLAQKNVATLYHPPYSPDLSAPDYFLFPKFKMN